MRKKSKKRTSVPKRSTFIDKLPKNHGEWLKVVISLTEKAGPQMNDQLNRLKKELIQWNQAHKSKSVK